MRERSVSGARQNRVPALLSLCRMDLRTGRFDGRRKATPPHRQTYHPANARSGSGRSCSGDRELAFLGDPFESLGGTLDPILAVVTVGREQPDHLIGAAGGRSCNIAGSEIDSLSNGIFVLQRPLPSRKNAGHAHGPASNGQTEKPCDYIAQRRSSWPVHKHMTNAQKRQAFQYDNEYWRLQITRRHHRPEPSPAGFRRYAEACRPDWLDPRPWEAAGPEFGRVDRSEC